MKAQQRLYFLRILRKNSLQEKVLVSCYRLSIESVLTDAKEWANFYNYFGITVDTNTDKTNDTKRKECYQKHVVFGTVETFAADHLRQTFEMKDVRPDRGYQCIIIDEVDSLLLDQGVQLTYLSSNMVSMQHLNVILAMIWGHVNQYGLLSTGIQTFVREEILINPIAECIKEKLQFTPCENDNSKISIPGFLRNLVENKVSTWVQNAFLAMSLKEVIKEIAQCISLSSPGPHVSLVILQLGRFTQEEQDTVKIIQETFGAEAARYTMVLFTHGDQLEGLTIEEYINGSEMLGGFIRQCHGGYHVFNNEEVNNRTQVTELLQKIDKMVTENGGSCYTNEMREEERKRREEERMVLLGKVGCGKSAAGNTILGREDFRSSFFFSAVTKRCEVRSAFVHGRLVTVVDTPGVDYREVSEEELLRCTAMAAPHALLLVIQLGRFTEEHRASLQRVEKVFGETAKEFTMILFTYGDFLKRETIDHFIRKYCSYSTGIHKVKDLRIALVGKTGVGKSAAGNIILGKKAFESKLSPSSVTSRCKKQRGKVDGREVAVVDTPGLFDTKLVKDAVIKEIGTCICLSSPGPHVFLVVIQLSRFTQEEQDTVKIIQETFGAEAARYTMVLFTHGDQLEGLTIEEYINGSEMLGGFIRQCHGGYHVFNNEEVNNRTQVTELLQKIDKMVTVNGGSCYTNEMYKMAEEAIEDEKRRILRENEGKIRREEEKLKAKYGGGALEKAIEELHKEHEREARDRAERSNTFLKKAGIVFSSMAAGAGAGAAIGAVGGPVGIGIGAAAGAVVGAASAATGINIRDKCTTQ
ncbi:GTPase IMAP family member 8-like [Megalops cyprinoides]|uniref:GTPase IMAP family member 8-like n=1 Tax=Megalops cyprinoides TaxID=118141 RepID=UPI0018642B8D|nr:GTPase IMAP family member 8-like [Megalops cyprinoides]